MCYGVVGNTNGTCEVSGPIAQGEMSPSSSILQNEPCVIENGTGHEITETGSTCTWAYYRINPRAQSPDLFCSETNLSDPPDDDTAINEDTCVIQMDTGLNSEGNGETQTQHALPPDTPSANMSEASQSVSTEDGPQDEEESQSIFANVKKARMKRLAKRPIHQLNECVASCLSTEKWFRQERWGNNGHADLDNISITSTL